MTTAANWEVHPTGAHGVWVVRRPGDSPWTAVAVVYYYADSGRWLCQRCQRAECEHVRAVQAGGWPTITPARATPEPDPWHSEAHLGNTEARE